MVNHVLGLVLAIAAPLVASPLTLIAGHVLGRRGAEAIGLTASLLSLTGSLILFQTAETVYVDARLALPWVPGGPVTLGFLVDELSRLFTLIVGLVGFLVTVYSVAYMAGDPGYARYYALLLLFIGSMQALVLVSNLAAAYVFWETVGLCSFALIGHYYTSPRASLAGVKAFVVTRFADVAFAAAVAYAYTSTGCLDYRCLAASSPHVLGLTSLLVLVASMGKSAQLPLHIWLPDAMEGPTPVSALIHAATMVKAGVYMVSRLVVLGAPSWLSSTILVVGAATALYAAVCAAAQYDAKRLLAYSTISQLGFLFAGIGASLGQEEGLEPVLDHVASHAVFKALLFLAVGVAIHELEHLLGPEVARDMRRVRGCLRGSPVASIALLFGALSLAGVPPFSGSWSKEFLVASVAYVDAFAATLLVVASIATAFYAAKLAYMLALAKPLEDSMVVRKTPTAMSIPLLVLSVLTLTAPVVMGYPRIHVDILWTLLGVLACAAGFALALIAYRYGVKPPASLYRAALEGFYLDTLYARILAPVARMALTLLARGTLSLFDSGVYVAASSIVSSSRSLSEQHVGRIPYYMLSLILGLLVVVAVALASG